LRRFQRIEEAPEDSGGSRGFRRFQRIQEVPED